MSAAMPKFDAATAIGDSCKVQAASPRYVDPPSLSYELDAMCHLFLNSYRYYWFMQKETTDEDRDAGCISPKIAAHVSCLFVR